VLSPHILFPRPSFTVTIRLITVSLSSPRSYLFRVMHSVPARAASWLAEDLRTAWTDVFLPLSLCSQKNAYECVLPPTFARISAGYERYGTSLDTMWPKKANELLADKSIKLAYR
jgi:hypothetical protein